MPSSSSRASRAIWKKFITKTANSSKRTICSSRSSRISTRISYSKLVKQDAATQTEVDHWNFERASAEASLLSAQASVALAKLNLSYTEVRAPFDGIVGKHLIDH